MTDPVPSSWPMPLRIASLAALVGVSGWLIWQTQVQSNTPASAAPTGVAVPPPSAASSSAVPKTTPEMPRADAPAPLPTAAAAMVAPAPAPAPSLEAAALPPAPEPTGVAVDAPSEPGGNAAQPTYFHSSKAMVLSADSLTGPKEPDVPAPPGVMGRNPVFLHSSKAMMPTALPSLAGPDEGGNPDAEAPQDKQPPPVYIPSSKFADPALFERVVEEKPAPSPQQQQQR